MAWARWMTSTRWSIHDIGRFWDAVARDLELEWYTPYAQVVDLERGPRWPRWWVGGKFNYVHNALDKHARRRQAGADLRSRRGPDQTAHLSASCSANQPLRQRPEKAGHQEG